MRVTVASRNARSWTRRGAPASRRRCSSSHSSAPMSRWFVGSSSISRSGSEITSRASAAASAPRRTGRRRPDPPSRANAEARQRLLDALVERVAVERVEPCWRSAYSVLDAVPACSSAPAPRPCARGRPPRADRGPHVRRGRERRVEVRLLAEQPQARPRLRHHVAAVGLVTSRHDAQQRRLARAVRPHEPDPLADARWRRDPIEDHERRRSRGGRRRGG